MSYVLQLANTYGAAFGAIGAAIAFVWSVYQFFSVRARDARTREFETFHKLIKELVEPPAEGASLYIDRSVNARTYELLRNPGLSGRVTPGFSGWRLPPPDPKRGKEQRRHGITGNPVRIFRTDRLGASVNADY